MRQAKYQQHGGKCPAKCGQVDKPQRQAHQHGQKRTDRRAAGYAQYIGIRQRIAQQHLHQGTGQRQQTAASKGAQGTRQTQAAYHLDSQRCFACRAAAE